MKLSQYICPENYGLNWLKGQHEPLISVALFEKVQKRREEASYAPARKNIGDDFALRGFVNCCDCSTPLRSSWPKGKYKRYAYYLCQTKGCASYGKSIPRDKLEGEVGDLIRTLEPSQQLFDVAKLMFKNAWAARAAQVEESASALKRQIAQADKQIETLL